MLAEAGATAGTLAGGLASLAHGAVTVVRTGISRAAQGKELLMSKVSPRAGSGTGASPLTSGLPALQHHLAALQVPLDEAMSAPGWGDAPLASPLEPAGHKQRAMQHIRKQAGGWV